jgi:DNA-binding transcriptional LysR family regulator
MMINIPTEMLRTLVAVVDHKSFTKAALSLGVTQPAVSAQIKRLQIVLGVDLFAKDVAGIVLTQSGDEVVTYARRLLSLNDQIVKIAAPEPNEAPIKLGATGDYFSPLLPEALGKFRQRWPGRKFSLSHAPCAQLLQQLRAGDIDVVVSFSPEKPERDARYHWTEELTWVRGRIMPEPLPDIVPLVARDEHWMNQGLAIAALEKIGRGYEFTFKAPTILGLLSAVRNGFGIMPFVRRRLGTIDLVIVEDPTLPPLPDVVCSISVREIVNSEIFDDLARAIADVVKPSAGIPNGVKLSELVPIRG